jgi:hypothetical protein
VWLAAGIEFSFHRLALAGWQPAGVLRHWAVVPWQSIGKDQYFGVALACLPGEALWLGLTNVGAPASVLLQCVDAAQSSAPLLVPPDWQLCAHGPADRRQPIALDGAAERCFLLRVKREDQGAPETSETLTLELLSASIWTARYGSLNLVPAEEPPLMERYSRIARQKRPAPHVTDP